MFLQTGKYIDVFGISDVLELLLVPVDKSLT